MGGMLERHSSRCGRERGACRVQAVADLVVLAPPPAHLLVEAAYLLEEVTSHAERTGPAEHPRRWQSVEAVVDLCEDPAAQVGPRRVIREPLQLVLHVRCVEPGGDL